MKSILKINFLIAICLFCGNLKAQDMIVKTSGDSIKAKITEVGTNAISFKKWDNIEGPTFVVNKSEILFVRYKNGQIDKFTPAIPTTTSSASSFSNSIQTNTNSVMSNTNSASSSMQQPGDGKNKIERDGKKYMINGKKSKMKDVNKLLASSKNPAITVPLKAAKMTKGAQKIVKLTSIPTSIGGGFTTLVSVIDLYNDVRRGRDNTKTYTNFGLSLVGTLTLPITNKILKNKSDKMYDKLIDLYNVTN